MEQRSGRQVGREGHKARVQSVTWILGKQNCFYSEWLVNLTRKFCQMKQMATSWPSPGPVALWDRAWGKWDYNVSFIHPMRSTLTSPATWSVRSELNPNHDAYLPFQKEDCINTFKSCTYIWNNDNNGAEQGSNTNIISYLSRCARMTPNTSNASGMLNLYNNPTEERKIQGLAHVYTSQSGKTGETIFPSLMSSNFSTSW